MYNQKERINPSTERMNPFPTVGIPDIIGKFEDGVTRRVGKLVGNAFMRSSDTKQKRIEPLIKKQAKRRRK